MAKHWKNCHTKQGQGQEGTESESALSTITWQQAARAAGGMQQAAVIKSCNKKLLGVHSGSPRLLLVLMACNFSLAPDSRVRGQVRRLLLLLLGLAWLLTANGKCCGKDEAAGEGRWQLGWGWAHAGTART